MLESSPACRRERSERARIAEVVSPCPVDIKISVCVGAAEWTSETIFEISESLLSISVAKEGVCFSSSFLFKQFEKRKVRPFTLRGKSDTDLEIEPT